MIFTLRCFSARIWCTGLGQIYYLPNVQNFIPEVYTSETCFAASLHFVWHCSLAFLINVSWIWLFSKGGRTPQNFTSALCTCHTSLPDSGLLTLIFYRLADSGSCRVVDFFKNRKWKYAHKIRENYKKMQKCSKNINMKIWSKIYKNAKKIAKNKKRNI